MGSPNPMVKRFLKLKEEHKLDDVELDFGLPSGAQGGGDVHMINQVKIWEKSGGCAKIVTYDLYGKEIDQGHVTWQWVEEHTIKPKWDLRSGAYVPDSKVD